MSAGIPDRAARWRELAAEARANAEVMNDAQARQIMLSIAEAYERLAKRAEDRKAANGESGK
jgi:hypothetical protein